MAHDLIKGRQGGRDWSCGIGDEAPRPMPTAAIFAAGAVAVGATVAGVLVASSLGGKKAPPSYGPPTMFAVPTKHGYSINPRAAGYFAQRHRR